MSDRFKDKFIDTLLTEYQACHMNRNHYDSLSWTICSIFTSASLALLGISFLNPVVNNPLDVILIASFSILIFVIYMAYERHARPWIKASLDRCHEIEEELRRLGFHTTLHTNIRGIEQIRGIWILRSLVMIVLFAWIFRIMFLFI
ncbi:MAG: hypothetical protein NWE90_04655 [Candidatus Bathyarchaeota archaeon]|nr:hypothetical protein [Candidatus Bathyarchaeota archaeon]